MSRPLRVPFGDTVVVQRAAVVQDSMGDEYLDWNNPVETTYEHVVVIPGASSETYQVGRNPIDISVTLHFTQTDVDIKTTDRVVVRGITHDVEAQPFVWNSPYDGKQWGVEVTLKTRQG